MATHLLTGFPGLLGSALAHRILATTPDVELRCLVHLAQYDAARRRLHLLADRQPGARERVELMEGDLVIPGLGVDPARLTGVTQVHHLAAIYDLAVPEVRARAVNVEGTRHLLEVARGLPELAAFNHVSTCYVAGDAARGFGEADLEVGQRFHNHYESTKYESEVLVRRALDGGMPGRIFRPAVVVGDHTTGATAKYDGLYFVIRYLMRWRRHAVLGIPSCAGGARFNAVPRDWLVEAIWALASRPDTLGRTFQLADSTPPRVPELVQALGHHLRRRVHAVPIPLAPTRATLQRIPALARVVGIPGEALDYFRHPGNFDVGRTLSALQGVAPRPPTLLDYLETLVAFVERHPEAPPAWAWLPAP